jgi:hypothetical protein
VCGSFIFRGKDSSAKFQVESLTPAILEFKIVDEGSNRCCVDERADHHFLLIPSLLNFNSLTFII